MNTGHVSFVKKFSRNSAFMLTGTIIANAGIFITNIILARFLSKPDYGVVVTVQYVSALFVLLMNFGIPDRTTKAVATALSTGDRGSAGKAIRTATVLMLCIFTVLAALQAAFAGVIAGRYSGPGTEFYVRLSALWGIPFFISLLGFAVVEGTQNIRWPYLLRNAYEPLKLLSAGILILASAFTVRYIFITWTALYLAYGGMVLLYLLRALKTAGIPVTGPVSGRSLARTFGKSIPFFMPFISPVLINTLLPLMIAGIRTPAEVAAFAVILPFTSLTPLLFMSQARALLPAVSADFTRKRESIGRIVTVLFKLTGLANISIFTVLAVAGPQLISTFFGTQYVSSHRTLVVLLAAAYFDNFKFALDPLLKGTGHVKLVALLDYIRIGTLTVLGYPVISRYGAAGAAALLAVTSAPVLVMKLHTVRSRLGISLYTLFVRETLVIALAGAGAFMRLPLPFILAYTLILILLLKIITRHELGTWYRLLHSR